MINDDEEEFVADERDDIETRIDELDDRTSRIDELEARILELEERLRELECTDLVHIKRFWSYLSRMVATTPRAKANDNARAAANEVARDFPITERKTALVVLVLWGLRCLLTRGFEPGYQLLAAWLVGWLFICLIPGALAFCIAGRKKDWSRNDRWFFWGVVIMAILLVATSPDI